MAVRKARAKWTGTLRDGSGRLRSETGAVEGSYTFGSRFEEAEGTNPEELIAAAHAGCFAMALAGNLAKAGYPPESIEVEGAVRLEKSDGGFAIEGVLLTCEASVPDIDEEAFQEQVEAARVGCPVSQALKAITIEVDARLAG